MSTSNRPSQPYLDEASRPDTTSRPWWRTGVFAGALLAAFILGVGAWIVYGLGETPGMTTGDRAAGGMGGDMEDMAADAPRIPPVLGYYGGEQVFFIHTEASDAEIAQTLEGMMGSPVPVVESLAEVPDDARSPVYAFANGLTPADTPAGPLGFQPDVFATAPGDEDYTPLRELVLVTWGDDAQARVLTSAQEVTEVEAAGEVSFERPGVVINIPLLTWPGGQR
jgi:hypothetical protein